METVLPCNKVDKPKSSLSMNCDWLSRPKALNHSWLLYEQGIQGTALAMQNKLSSFLRLFKKKEMQKKWSMYLFPRSLLMEWIETIVSVVRELVTTIIKTLQEWDEIHLAEIRFTYISSFETLWFCVEQAGPWHFRPPGLNEVLIERLKGIFY